jgi:hypothetical protein
LIRVYLWCPLHQSLRLLNYQRIMLP